MTDRRVTAPDDTRLEAALRELANAVDWPSPTRGAEPDLATRVRVRLTERGDPRRVGRSPGWRWPPLRWALVLALVAALALVALAGAAGLGLPGLRIILGEPSGPPPTVGPSRTVPPGRPGADLHLGRPVTLEEAAATAGPLRLPAEPRLGPPDAVYVDPARGNQVALVWAAGPELPATLEPGVGLILMTFDGTLDEGIFQKIVGPASVLERLQVSDRPGWWIAGDQHMFLYRSKDGEVVNDERRWVGDALLWSDGTKTYRIESALGRDSTVAIAESLP